MQPLYIHHQPVDFSTPAPASQIRRMPGDDKPVDHSIKNTGEVIAPNPNEGSISSPQGARWIIAMDKEVESLHENRTWKLIELPPAYVDGVKIVIFKGRWVYKVKTGVDGKAALEKER